MCVTEIEVNDMEVSKRGKGQMGVPATCVAVSEYREGLLKAGNPKEESRF